MQPNPVEFKTGNSGAALPKNQEEIITGYTVAILQEPVQARMSGLTNTASRRMLDPPLVLNVKVKSAASKIVEEKDKENLSMDLVCLVELVDGYGKSQSFASAEYDNHYTCTQNTEKDAAIDRSKILTLLLGQTARSCSYMNLSENEKSLLFIFSDLSIRVQGHYRISCTVVHLKRYDLTKVGALIPIEHFHTFSGRIDKLETELFQVYTPQFYPGLLRK
jgi:hypothetical protein